MKKQFNEKGMTLVEIVVVLLISSILMFLCGTLIINSMGYFNTTATANLDKLTTDKLAEQVRTTLVYASKVQISDVQPEGDRWHSISISPNHTLVIDGKEQFTIGFYNQREFVLTVRRYQEDYRMDLTYALVWNGETTYERDETLELINMKERTLRDDNIVETQILDTMKIYYQIEGNSPQNQPDNPTPNPDPYPSGLTVEDERNCLDKTISKPEEEGNNKGVWKTGQRYELGNFVMYPNANGTLYRLTLAYDDTSMQPDKSFFWKKIDKNYTANTQYNQGDIILYENKYYQAKYDNTVADPTTSNVWYGPTDTAHELLELSKQVPTYTKECSTATSRCSGSVGDEYLQMTTANTKGTWTVASTFRIGDFVTYSGSQDHGVLYWYRAVKSNMKSYVPGANSEASGSGWKRIKPVSAVDHHLPAAFSMTSAYLKGDIVYDPANGYYYEAIINNEGSKQTIWGVDPPSNPLYWKKIEKPLAGSCAT